MSLYKGGSKIKELYVGNTKIKELYVGSTLVFSSGLPPGTIIFESSTPGTYEITIPETRNYDIKLVGGGANGTYMVIGGAEVKLICGSGAYIYGITELQAGTYTVVVGKKGGAISTAGTNTTAFGQIAGGGPKNIVDQATYTVSLSGLSGINGNVGGSQTGGESLYNGYGRGGTKPGISPESTDGYIKIEVA